MKDKKLISLIPIAIISGVMLFTNPSKTDYIDYAATRFVKQTKEAMCKTSQTKDTPEWQKTFGELVEGACKGALELVGKNIREDVEKYISNATEKQNFLLFTIYSTELLDQKIHTVGVFGNFITLSRTNS